MKQNRKGFSLVELIVVLVIMAIIAALCAPNISAYVQAAKIQNYQTVANNLADELQTQLPQNRYWNWDEVKQSAYGILSSDAGRGVTLLSSSDTEEKYQITGASSDANAVFTVTLTYQPADKTSQTVEVAVSCDGYAAVQSAQSCSLVLKTNYTDTNLYQEISLPNPNRDESGWKPMKDMGGTYDYWKSYNNEHNEHDFGSEVVDAADKAFYLNLTDYPAGTCEQVVFTMERYQVYVNDSSYDDKGYYDKDGVWHHCDQDTYRDHYYIDNNGNKHTCYFCMTIPWRDHALVDEGETQDGYKTYTDYYECHTQHFENIRYQYTPVYPRLQVQSAKGTGGQEAVADDFSNVDIYAGIDETGKEIWLPYTDVFDINGNKLLRSTEQAQIYKEYYNDDIVDGSLNATVYTWNEEKANVYIKYRINKLPSSTRGWLYITGMVQGNNSTGEKINPIVDDSLQVYINYHRDSDTYDANPKLLATESGNMWNQYYKKLWIDVSECGYCVNDVLKITLSNVDVDKLKYNLDKFYVKMTTPDKQSGSETEFTEYGQSWFDNHVVLDEKGNPTYNPSYDFEISGEDTPGKWEKNNVYQATISSIKENTVELRIKMLWYTYPYIYIYFPYAKDDFSFSSHIEMEWESGGDSSGDPITTSTPMLTINGDNTYTNITLDWTKCDYITNVGEVGIQFDKYPSNLKYDVYSKDYTQLASGQSLSKFMMNSNSAVTPSAAADKIVHLYCKGLSPEDISCSIVAPSAPITTDTTTTTTTTTTTSAETETTAKTTSAAETTSTTTSSTTTTTTSATTTTSTTTSTTTETSTTTSTTTTATTSSTTTSAATTSTVTSTSAVTSSSVSTSSTSTSATTSTTTSITATTTTSATETSGSVVTTVVTGVNYNVSIAIPNHNNLIGIELKFTSCGNFPNVKWFFNNYTQYLDIQSKGMLDENNSIYISVNGNADAAMTVQNYNTYDGMGDLVSVKFYYKQSDGSGTTPVEEKPSYEENMIVFDGDAFKYNQSYDISKYWFVNSEDSKRVPDQIQIEFAKGNHNCQAELSASQFQTESWSGSGETFAYYGSITGNETNIYTIPSSDINKISLLKDVSIKITSYSGNAKVQTIKFIYSNDTATAKFTRIMTRGESISAIFTESIPDVTNEVVTTTINTTTPQPTTTTTTTVKPIAASENGKNVGLDETSAAGCDITFSESLFNESGVCYFTITPKAGYTLSDGYTVKVGTEVLSPKNNYNPKTGQWFFWSNKSMTDYTIHVEGISPAA